MSDWFLRRWDPFDLDWSLTRHFEEIDRLMDRSFGRFEREMDFTRQRMLQDINAQNLRPAITPQSTTYTKEQHSVDQHEAVIDGKRISIKTLETSKEKDGVKIPHVLREVTCDPPCELDTVRDYVKLKETIGQGHNQKFLDQFVQDCKSKNMAPAKLVKYQNEIVHDSEQNKDNFTVNVSFLDNNDKRHVYQFSRGQDAIMGETKFDAIESGQTHTGEFAKSGQSQDINQMQQLPKESKGPQMNLQSSTDQPMQTQ